MEPRHTIVVYPSLLGHDLFRVTGTHFATDDTRNLWVYDGTTVVLFAPQGAYLCAISCFEMQENGGGG